jgi:hypothetical protein
MRQNTNYRSLFLVAVFAVSIPSLAAAQSRHDAGDTAAQAATSAASPQNLDPVDAKMHAQLRAALDARAQGLAWTMASGLPAALRRDDEVLVEVRFVASQELDDAQDVLLRHGATLRNSLSPALHEAWMPLDRLRELAGDASVVRITPARLARPLATTSQGVAAGNVDYWQKFNPAYTGTGITIAMIDAYDKTTIAALQSSGDWPPTARLSCYDVKDIVTNPPYAASSCTAGGFGSGGVRHGDLTMEIVYDVAPGATYRAYDTVTVGDWRNSILDAANVNASGASLGAVRANVISASLAAPLDGIGDGTAQPGSIAQAAGFAQARGVLVVNAAGNEREQHWGGAYQFASGSSGFHTWDGNAAHLYNSFLDASGNPACIASGTLIEVDMYWNDWVTTNHNYDLYLYQASAKSGSTLTWNNTLPVAQSVNSQNGGSDTPQESFLYVTADGATTTGCSSGAVYGIAVVRVVGTTANDNLQVFASLPLTYDVPRSSLVFPADSPNVLSVAAIDVANATNTPQEAFSSEGPVLAAGGGISAAVASSDPNLKPDLASFDHVTTVTNGVSNFYGTSAAAPQVAGMAALFMQRFGVQSAATNLKNAIVTPLRMIASTGTNDLGTAGRDYQYGYGRLRFQKDAALAFIQQPMNALVNTAIAPPITVGIHDGEAKLDMYTLFDTLTLAIGNDPNGGAAVLSGAGSGNLVAGVATWAAAKLNLGGTGYRLTATASAATTPPISLAVTSNAFNITTGAATKLAFMVQPSQVVAGHAISPVVKVAVEDNNGNLVNTDNTTSITVTRTSCGGLAPAGGGPVTVASGIASFPGLTLQTPGSAILTATAQSRSPATSMSFTINANPDYLFRGGFETCIP